MDFKSLIGAVLPLLARMNKATVTAAITFVIANAAIFGLHIDVAPVWQEFLATVALALAHALVVYWTPNQTLDPSTGKYRTIDTVTLEAPYPPEATKAVGTGQALAQVSK